MSSYPSFDAINAAGQRWTWGAVQQQGRFILHYLLVKDTRPFLTREGVVRLVVVYYLEDIPLAFSTSRPMRLCRHGNSCPFVQVQDPRWALLYSFKGCLMLFNGLSCTAEPQQSSLKMRLAWCRCVYTGAYTGACIYIYI